MSHLTEQRLYALAGKLCHELLLEEQDRQDLEHISQCEECYEALQCAMALMESVEQIHPAMLLEAEAAESTVIQVVVMDVRALLQQVGQNRMWMFEEPLAPVGARGEQEQQRAMLEDIDNSQTFVAYDEARRCLVIQVDPQGGPAPSVKLRLPDGSHRPVSLQRWEHLLRAEIPDLPNGEYFLILEK